MTALAETPSAREPRRVDRRSDELLIAGCRAGDERAWAALIARYKALIYSIPFRYGANAEESADIFQAVCLDLYLELPRLREAGALRSWLAAITAHKAYHWKRRRHGRPEVAAEVDADRLADPDEETPAERLQALESQQLVREALAEISERCQRMLHMLFLEDPPRPYREVAASFGLATGSVGFIRGRCLERLEKALQRRGF